jgi:molybdopterin converting factor small subunit
MRTVTVRFFAVFRENTGVESCRHESEAGTLKELFREMTVQFPSLHFEAAALVAVNDTMASWEQGFEQGDEVLFFPPVAGG